MKRVLSGGRWAFLIIILALVVTGCSSRGVVNAGWTVVAATDDSVYAVLATGKVVALDAATGLERWYYPITQPSSGGLGALFAPKPTGEQQTVVDAVYGLPVITDDLVIVGAYNNRLFAFNRTSGQKVWEYTTLGPIVGGITDFEGYIYFGAADSGVSASRVYALRSITPTAEVAWDVPVTKHWIWGAPAADEKQLYIGSMDHHVYALNRETGAIVWEQDMGAAVPGSVSLADNVVYVGGVAKKLTALRSDTGEMLWEKALGQWVWGQAVVSNSVVYVGTLDGIVHALAVQDGSLKWDSVQLEGAIRAGPVIAGEYLVIGTDTGVIYRIQMATGKAEKLYTITGASVLSKIAVVGDRLYVGTTSATVVALDITRVGGAPLWVYPAAVAK
ncbi:MAG: outer membrane protein assembly factor BamB family protein [Anaerolineae bacterium]